MTVLRYGFVVFMAAQVAASLAGDRATYRRGALRKSLARLRRSPILSRELWDQLKDYNRRDFHPDDRDTNELVERLRAELFGDSGSLNATLARPPHSGAH